MDRFIGKALQETEQFNKVFKIQYGQIYRAWGSSGLAGGFCI